MRRIFLFLFLICACACSTMADPDNLAGGVLITHYVPPYSPPLRYPVPCYDYDAVLEIDDASQQLCRTDYVSTYQDPAIWYVLAAFHEDKTWCGTQFGLGDYNNFVFYLIDHGQCLSNSLEIPTAGWPRPNTGISIAATDEMWEGNFRPIYYFRGYAYMAALYGDYTPTLIELTDYPGQNFMGFGNCEAPSQTWPAEGGALGVFTDGVAVYPQTPGACCDSDGVCEVKLEQECDGEFVSVTTCDPNPCPQSLRACCDENDVCSLTEQGNCDGEWLADEISCEPNPCQISRSDGSSWGEIKVLYR
jgi:hypothetical protein